MPEIEVVDATRLRDSLQCLRLYYWSHERCIQPVKPRLPLVHGQGVHATLAAHYEGLPAGVCLQKYEEIYDAEITPYLANQSLLGEADGIDQKRNPVRWMKVYMLYRQTYQTEPFQVIGKPESPFLLQVTDDLAFGGVVDLLINYCGQTMVMDHKTAAWLGQSYYNSFNPNHQFSVYLIAANELIKPDRPITTLMVNCILSHATQMKPESLFTRVPTTRSPDQLTQSKAELINWWQIVRECRRTGSWPRNDDRCQRWNGGCSYHSLCTEIQTDYRKLIPSKTQFTERQWDPIQSLRSKGLEIAK
jgi:hypothetical protein